MKSLLFKALGASAVLSLLVAAAIPLELSISQDLAIVSVLAMVILALMPGSSFKLMFFAVSTWVIIRYLSWRFYSFPLDTGIADQIFAGLLLLAEIYGSSVLLIGFFVNANVLDRKVTPLPKDSSNLPSVDIYIPTYSESIAVIEPTLLGALNVRYPDKSKVNVFILDDGYPRAVSAPEGSPLAVSLFERADDLKALCAKHGAFYLTRTNNNHAKSGNLNEAMKSTTGELIVVLDADHVPTVDFLENTIGSFINAPNLAFVQTPHFFLNADPVERNLGLFNKMPAENDMFYRVVQKGLDLWNTSFFCGSAAVIRRTSLVDVGGFSHDSITEDASTSIKMHSKGWDSAYIGKPMICGLQPESFSSFIVQRLRWAMGMMQIFIKQNPILLSGLSLGQRLSYLSVVAFWLFPFARVIFFMSPILFVVFNLALYPPGFDLFLTYTVPYLFASVLAFDKMFGSVRRFLVSELYETLQAFYTLPALVSTIFSPNSPKFKVTPKGEMMSEDFVSELKTPFVVVSVLTVATLLWALLKMYSNESFKDPLMLATAWLMFNMVLLGGSLGVVLEKAQRRGRPRIDINLRAAIEGDFGTLDVLIIDANELGFRFKLADSSAKGDVLVTLDGEKVPATILSDRAVYLKQGEHVALFKPEISAHELAINKFVYGSSARWEATWSARESSSNIFVSFIGFVLLAAQNLISYINIAVNKASKDR